MPKGQYDYKIRKLELQTVKRAQDMAVLQQFIASPLVQILGTVTAAEGLEAAGILSSRWAGAVEGGVIAMVGLQALKDYGVLGAGSLGLGMSTGLLAGISSEPGNYSAIDRLLSGALTAIGLR